VKCRAGFGLTGLALMIGVFLARGFKGNPTPCNGEWDSCTGPCVGVGVGVWVHGWHVWDVFDFCGCFGVFVFVSVLVVGFLLIVFRWLLGGRFRCCRCTAFSRLPVAPFRPRGLIRRGRSGISLCCPGRLFTADIDLAGRQFYPRTGRLSYSVGCPTGFLPSD
jgi:hypothetical protein